MMINRYAIVEDGTVVNVALWDGTTEWDGNEGAVLLPENSPVDLGYTYDGLNFTAPPPPPPFPNVF
jgi:hypothetical protein